MRIIIERDALAEAVAWVARSLPSRPVLPILSGMLLEASAGGLTLSCFDYEVSARIQVDAEVAEPGTALVPGRLLAEITRSLPSLPVELDHEKDDVIVTCGPASFTLVTLPVKEYPRLPELPLLAGTVDGGALATAIGQVAPGGQPRRHAAGHHRGERRDRRRLHPAGGDRQVPARHPGARLESRPARIPAARCWCRPRRWRMPRG